MHHPIARALRPAGQQDRLHRRLFFEIGGHEIKQIDLLARLGPLALWCERTALLPARIQHDPLLAFGLGKGFEFDNGPLL